MNIMNHIQEIKYICLFVAIFLTIWNVGAMRYKLRIPIATVVIHALSITVFLILQFGL